MLKLQNINKTFNEGTINEKKALIDINLHLNPQDFVTVIGGNGAGKSTMLNMVAGVYPVDSGKITLASTPFSLSAAGKEPATSPRPPVLTKGAASEVANKTFITNYSFLYA